MSETSNPKRIKVRDLKHIQSFATEELSAKLGETIGGLMNATFGNAVELIVSLRARVESQLD